MLKKLFAKALYRLSLRVRPPQAGEGGERSELLLTFWVKVKCIRCAHPLSRRERRKVFAAVSRLTSARAMLARDGKRCHSQCCICSTVKFPPQITVATRFVAKRSRCSRIAATPTAPLGSLTTPRC